MRLSECERRGLTQALEGLPFPVFLFGSRLDDTRRGGDIDLAVLARGLTPAERLALSLRVAVRFRSVCDEKIDVQVFDTEALSAEEQAFLAITRREALALP
jgi:predicted nucleotidyltransferase